MDNKSIILRSQNRLIRRSITRMRLYGKYKKCPVCPNRIKNTIETENKID